MKRFVEGEDRSQSTLFPERLDEYVAEDNSVRVIDVFVDELDLGTLGFERVEPKQTGRPAYHPATMLKVVRVGSHSAHLFDRSCDKKFGAVLKMCGVRPGPWYDILQQ